MYATQIRSGRPEIRIIDCRRRQWGTQGYLRFMDVPLRLRSYYSGAYHISHQGTCEKLRMRTECTQKYFFQTAVEQYKRCQRRTSQKEQREIRPVDCGDQPE